MDPEATTTRSIRAITHELRNALGALHLAAAALAAGDAADSALPCDHGPGPIILRAARRVNDLMDELLSQVVQNEPEPGVIETHGS